MTQPPEKKPHSEKRHRQIQVKVRLSKEEHAHLLEMARLTNYRPQQVIRALIMNLHLKPVRMYPDETYRQIASVSNNVNQIARKLNTGAVPGREDIAAYREDVAELVRCLYSK